MSDPYEEIELEVFNQANRHIEGHLNVDAGAAIRWAETDMEAEFKTLRDALHKSQEIEAATGDVKEFKKACVLWCKQMIKVSKGCAAYSGQRLRG